MATTMSPGNETIPSVNNNFMSLARSYMMFKMGNIFKFDNLTQGRIYLCNFHAQIPCLKHLSSGYCLIDPMLFWELKIT